MIVADNGSTDHTAAIARERACRVVPVAPRVIAAVRNGGAAIARGAFLAFVDADMQLHPDTFTALAAAHLIVDNYATHKHKRVKSWVRRHPRVHLHFTPNSSSRLNLVERWFRNPTDKRIRRGSFESVPELIATINDYTNTS